MADKPRCIERGQAKAGGRSAIVIVIVYTVIQISNGNICNTTITMSPSGDVNVLVGNTAVVYGLVNNSCGSNSFTPSCSINNISVINLSTKGVQFTNSDSRFIIQVPGKLEFDNTHIICCTEDGICSMVTLHVQSLPGRPNAMANTISPGMVLVVVNPSSSGGLPTSYNVTISNSSYGYSNSTPAFLNGFAMVTFTGLTIGTNYTISAVAINCAGSSNPTTIYVSLTPPTSGSSTTGSTNGTNTLTTAATWNHDPLIGGVVGCVVGCVGGGVVGLIIVGSICCVWLHHRRMQRHQRQEKPGDANPEAETTSYGLSTAAAKSARTPSSTAHSRSNDRHGIKQIHIIPLMPVMIIHTTTCMGGTLEGSAVHGDVPTCNPGNRSNPALNTEKKVLVTDIQECTDQEQLIKKGQCATDNGYVHTCGATKEVVV